MSNTDTVSAITENIRSALNRQGIVFEPKAVDDESGIAASRRPLGQVFYLGEAFEYAHGQRPGYIEAEFLIKVVLGRDDDAGLIRGQQKWAHRIRGALTVEALNTGKLSETKYVSRVGAREVRVENEAKGSRLLCGISVRYRES